jgi:hypothetical protein
MSHSHTFARIISILTLLALFFISGITTSPVTAASIVVNSFEDNETVDGLVHIA